MKTDCSPGINVNHTGIHAPLLRANASWCVAALLVLTLSSCSLIPPQPTPNSSVEVPARWSSTQISAATEVSPLSQWWLRFNDPLLHTLVVQALETNTNINTAQAALKQARALSDVAAAALLPTLGISAAAQRNTTGSSNINSSNSFRTGLDASWEIDIFGANRSALSASEATAQASSASLGEVQVSIAAEVALSYISLRGTEARLAIAESNLASQLETLQITQWRLQAGLISSLEAEQARAATEQTRSQMPAMQTSIEQTRHALAVLTDQPPASLANVLVATGAIPKAPDDIAISIPTETLRQRPDIQAAEQQVIAAVFRVSEANAARLPNFKLGGSLGLNALALGALTNGASVVSAILASVSMPIFDGGAGDARVRAQQAALDQARFAYKAAVLNALKDVENALIALRGDRERLLHLQQATEAAGNAALMARQRYESGIVDFQVVLETMRTQSNTQDSVVSASMDVGSDHIRLYKALGGGWLPENTRATSAQIDDANRRTGI